MSQLKNHSDFIQTLEHDDYSDPQTKRVSVYGWDADNLQKVRLSTDSTGKLNVNSSAPVGGATEAKQDSQITQVTNLTNTNVHTGSKELRVFSQGHVCAENSTSTPLGISATFTGAWQDTLDYTEIITTVYTDQNSTTDGMKVWWSADGITADPDPDVFTITAGVSKTFSFPCNRRYVKITYQNDGVGQSIMLLSTELKRFASKGSSHRLADTLNQQDDAIVTKSLVAGKTTAGGGAIVDVKVNPSGALTVDATGTVSVTGVSTATNQTSQITLETTLNSLTETLQELVQRLAPLAGAMAPTAQLRVTQTAVPSTAVTGPITSAQSIAEKNLGGVMYTTRVATENLNAVQSNINNCVVT